MLGRMLLVLVLGTLLAGTALWATGLLPVIAQDGSSLNDSDIAAPKAPQKHLEVKKAPKGGDLYALANWVSLPQDAPRAQKAMAADPIVISNSHLALIVKEEVPAQR